ncbi:MULTISPECIES: hypothetical protein [unclassified Saccharicrinis]|uniref:hypothetical protein n=1 Tax=unclassified Saccharicrinis TaxID=2646859 RepID=UPI003D33C028
MMQHSYVLIYSLVLTLFLCSCDIRNSNVEPEYNFVKVYDDEDVTKSYFPVGAIETDDGSIIILSAVNDSQSTNYPTIHVMKTDKSGNPEWETNVDPAYVSPVTGLLSFGGEIRFVCMDDNSFIAQVMEINTVTGDVTEVGDMPDSYPLAAHYSPETNTLVIASYDGIGYNTMITGYDASLNLSFELISPTNKDFSYDIFQHLKKQRAPFPFFIHSFENNGITYYGVNAFSNYTLSLLFVNHSSKTISGRVNGYQEQGGIGATVNKADGVFAIAKSKFNIGDIAFATEAAIDVNGIQNVTQLEDIAYPELSTKSNVKIVKEELNGKEMLVYAATTNSNQLALYFFDAETNELKLTEYLGHTNPVEISSFFKANDGGLIIAGKTMVAGRYERIILYKVATDEMDF